MQIYKPSDLRKLLEKHGIRAKKSLSQNFLIDQNIIQKILSEADVCEGDLIVEIGPGPGALTQALLKRGATVIAIEKDSTFIDHLSALKEEKGEIFVHNDDILKFPLEERLEQELDKGKKAKVVANLPYHLTTPILTKLVKMRKQISSLTLMVQDDMAVRMTAAPGGKDYSSLSLFLEFFSDLHYAFRVSRHCFYPAPKVESAIVHLKLTPPPKLSSEESFFTMTRKAFHQRRKMLRSSLKPLYPTEQLIEALKKLNIPETARPETLHLKEWLALFSLLGKT